MEKNDYFDRIAGILHRSTITRVEGNAICSEVLQHVDENEIDKVYCENCAFVDRSGGTNNFALDKCLAPIENWLSPTAPCNRACSCKNRGNDCKDFKGK